MTKKTVVMAVVGGLVSGLGACLGVIADKIGEARTEDRFSDIESRLNALEVPPEQMSFTED